MNTYLTEAEASQEFNVPAGTLRQRRYLGLGPIFVKRGRSVYYIAERFDETYNEVIHRAA